MDCREGECVVCKKKPEYLAALTKAEAIRFGLKEGDAICLECLYPGEEED